MKQHSDRGRVWFDDPDDFQRARDVLAAANYCEARVNELLGLKEIAVPRGEELPDWDRRTRSRTKLHTLIRLFLMGLREPVEAVEAALAPMTPDPWIRAGLLVPENGELRSPLFLQPYQNLVLLVDQPIRILKEEQRRDFVMGVGASTTSLARITVRCHVESFLDLGTGCGVHGLLAAGHCRRVVCTDRNRRAVDFAQFNAKLNRADNVEARAGNLFEPVEGDQFDVVVSNPPFVISPQSNYLYRDGGMERDQLCETIVRRVPSFLREGGWCQLLVNFANYPGVAWQDRLRDWFAGTGCDAWVACSRTFPPAMYATMWLSGTETTDTAKFTRLFHEWMAYYEHHQIEAISLGVVIMRRASDRPNWYYPSDAPERMVGNCGDAVLLTFKLIDYLETTTDDALLDEKLRVSAAVNMVSCCEPFEGRWRHLSAQLRRVQGFCYIGNTDTPTLDLVIKCDGRQPLRKLMEQAAANLNVSFERVVGPMVEVVRNLIRRGFLLPSQIDEPA
jgi:hypothetical protein